MTRSARAANRAIWRVNLVVTQPETLSKVLVHLVSCYATTRDTLDVTPKRELSEPFLTLNQQLSVFAVCNNGKDLLAFKWSGEQILSRRPVHGQ